MRHRSSLCRLLLCTATLLVAATNFSLGVEDPAAKPAAEKSPGAAMILSTGDNLFYYKWFPIDSPAGIGASFDIFKSHYDIDRIIWRGAQAQWMVDDSIFRPEPEETADLYVLEMGLESEHHLTLRGADEAKKRDLSFWGYMPLFDVGASPEAVAMAGFGPYNFEEKFRFDHPEFCLYDRAGVGIGSTIEFGYPEVRKAWLDRYERLFQKGGEFSVYEGVIFYTYVENFFPRYTDQYVFSDIAVKDFKERYGVDVLTQPFDMAKYQAMRGEYINTYLREMKQLFNKYGKKLAFYIDSKEPDIAMRWPCYPGILVPGTVKMDWRQWIKEGIVDEIALRTVTSVKDVQPFLDAAKGTNVRISILSNDMPPDLKPLEKSAGLTRHVWSPELPSDFPHEKAPLSALDGNDRIAMMSVLRQIRDSELDAPVEKLTALLKHEDLIVRRQAVAAILGRRMTDAIPALEQAAMDPENSFRCVVIDALGTLHGPNTVKTIGEVLAMYPEFGMRLVVRTAFSTMFSERSDEIVKLYQDTKSDYVRNSILELPIAKRAVPPVDAIPAFRPCVYAGLSDPNKRVRFTATFAAGYFPDRDTAEALLKQLDDKEEVIQDAAVFSLGEVARRVDDRAVREQIFEALAKRQTLYGEGSKRNDRAWAYRVVDEALIYGFGPRGERQVVSRLNGSDTTLGGLAWRVLFHPNDGWNFYEVPLADGESQYAYYPGTLRNKIERKTYTLPATAELLHQDFSGISPDPTGQNGSAWSATGKWTGLDENVRISDDKGKPNLQIGVGKNGRGARVVGVKGFDLSDGRFKNRLRGHFPSSPVAYGVSDGIADLSVEVIKSDANDSLIVGLAPDPKSKDVVGFVVGKDGKVQLVSGAAAPVDTGVTLANGAPQRITMRLDFKSGKLSVSSPAGAMSASIEFDANPHYRAIVLNAQGEPGTSTQVSDLRLSQTFE